MLPKNHIVLICNKFAKKYWSYQKNHHLLSRKLCYTMIYPYISYCVMATLVFKRWWWKTSEQFVRRRSTTHKKISTHRDSFHKRTVIYLQKQKPSPGRLQSEINKCNLEAEKLFHSSLLNTTKEDKRDTSNQLSSLINPRRRTAWWAGGTWLDQY